MTIQQAKELADKIISDPASSRQGRYDAWYLSKKIADFDRGTPSMKLETICERLQKLR